MASRIQSAAGEIFWTQIPCLDLDRVQKFYSAVFGWTFSPSPAPDFVIFSKGPTNGGFKKVEQKDLLSPAVHPDNAEKNRCAVKVSIKVDSVDEALKAVAANGGAVYMEKGEIPGNMGFIADFVDTENNVIGLWSQE